MAIKPVEILIKARDEASGIFGALQGKVVGLGVAIAGYFGISAFIGAVKGAADLEAKLSEVKAVSGATAAEMVLLRKAAEDAGATTKFTATEGAAALGNLTRAGLSAKDAITALPAVLQLAQAGGIGLAEASEYITKAVMGMGLAFTDAGRVADVLAMGANASNTSVTGLAQALSYAAPVAKSLGLGLEFTVAIIGKFADAGIDASRAGTALNAVLSQFSDPASKFRQELGAAGIITNNFEKALHQLAAAGPAGEKAILAVGTEAGPALRALLNQGIGALDDLKGKLDAAKGSAAATAAVMEDNLKGSFNSLSSAWDTVKNALATPVLPVLKDGVTELVAALSSAVSNGTVGKFGDAIAVSFQSGIKWVRAFVAETDFTALAVRLQAFAADTQAVFTKIGEYATNAGNIVKLSYGVMSAGANAVMSVIYMVGAGFAGVLVVVQNGFALLYESIAKITFGAFSEQYAKVAASIRESSAATMAVVDALGKKSKASFIEMGDSAQMASDGWTGLVTDTKAANTQATASTETFKSLAETLKEVGGDATATGQKAQAAGILQKQAADTTRAAVAQLKTEYEAAMAAGNVQLALEKLQAMQGALKSTGDQANLTGKDIENAFTRMGITSSAELAKLRDAALRDYKIIKEAATSTAYDKAEAFRVYAEKAIAANKGVATEALKAEASMRGVEIQTDSTGKTIVRAMSGGSNAVGQFTKNVGASLEEIKRMDSALDAINAKYGQSKAHLDGTYKLDEQTKATPGRIDLALATKILDATKTGGRVDMTSAELAQAKEQAKAAYDAVQTGLKNAPGLISFDALRSTEALYRASLNSNAVNITDKAAATGLGNTGTASAQATQVAKTYNVNITDNGQAHQYSAASDVDAQWLIKQLQSAKLSSGF